MGSLDNRGSGRHVDDRGFCDGGVEVGVKLDELKRVSANYEAGVIFPREKDAVFPALPDLIAAVEALRDLRALVIGEFPAALDGDRGGDDRLALRVDDAFTRLGVE